MSTRESTVETRVREFCAKHKITYQKQNGSGHKGKSDRLLMKAGIAAFLELKRPTEGPTALQEKYLRERRDDGFAAEWFDNAPAALLWIRKVFSIDD